MFVGRKLRQGIGRVTKSFMAMCVKLAAAILVLESLAGLGGAGRSLAGDAGTLPGMAGRAHFRHFRSEVDLASALQQSTSGATIPMWNGSFTYQNTTYSYAMVGTDPALGSKTTRIPVVIVPLEFDLPGGVVLSATAPVCGGTKSPVQLTKDSPIFKSSTFTPGGTKVGHTQYVDAFQRANFWNEVATISPKYHVKLKSPKILPTQVVSVPGASVQVFSGPCGNYAVVDFAFYITTLLSLRPTLPEVTPNVLAIVLTYNVFLTDPSTPGETILGFHYALDFGQGTQTLISAAYDDPGIFDGDADITTLSHEVGEWMDDPLANNPTPGWLAGQAVMCQSTLEVGDPVSGVSYPVIRGGVTYHPEDLVFLPWFAREAASTSVNGWYTFLNTFPVPPPACQ